MKKNLRKLIPVFLVIILIFSSGAEVFAFSSLNINSNNINSNLLNPGIIKPDQIPTGSGLDRPPRTDQTPTGSGLDRPPRTDYVTPSDLIVNTENGRMGNFQKRKEYTIGGFSDVDEGKWYGANKSRAIAASVEYGFMKGSGGSLFNPNGNLLLSEAAAIASRMHRIYYTANDEYTYSGQRWYDGYVAYDIVNGIFARNDFYDFDKFATRGEMAYIFCHILKPSELKEQNTVNSLPDVNASTPYGKEIVILYKAGVLSGNDAAGTFKPDSTITRAETAVIISRLADPAQRLSGKEYGRK